MQHLIREAADAMIAARISMAEAAAKDQQTLDIIKKLFAKAQQNNTANEAIVNDCYHVLEFCELDAVDIAIVTKRLRGALKKRRIIKEEMMQAQVIINNSAKGGVGAILSSAELKKRSDERHAQYVAESQAAIIKIRDQHRTDRIRALLDEAESLRA